MLRQIRLRNFVKFNGNHEHRIDFPKNGVYIFLGENNTGKSCVFEGIRRCMQTELNASISARHNPDNISYVICLFEKSKDDILTSCFVSFKEDNDTIFHKIVFYKAGNGNIIARSVRRKKEGRWGAFYECTLSDDKDKFHLLGSQLLNVYNTDEIASTEFIRFLKTNLSDNNAIEMFNQSFERIEFETIFAYRGINPIQTSRQIPIKDVHDRYKSANDLAFVIKTHLDDLRRNSSEVRDTDNEPKYFRCMTEPKSYTFQLKNKADTSIGSLENMQIVVSSEMNETPFPILKTPEGILESKVMSITLARRDTTTLLIEEPGRGMHPSMLDCLRDLVLYDVNTKQKKTVILTTHNQRFICPWTFEKMFYFYSSECGSEVISLEHALTDKKLKSTEYLCSDQISPIFFSKRVIMVEGPDDMRFLATLKNILLTDESRIRKICKESSETENKLKQFLRSLHIISMGGNDYAKQIEPLCTALQLTDRRLRFYLLDSDALLTIKALINIDKKNIGDPQLEILENNGIFVWFAYIKTIEELFDELCISDDLKRESRIDGLKKKRKVDVLNEDSIIEKLQKELKKYGRIEEALKCFYKAHDEKHHGPNNQCIIDKCTGMETFLKSKHLDTEKNKIWNSNDLTDTDMREIVKRIIDVSMTYGDDCKYQEIDFSCPFKRLMQFLINHAERSYQ
ncbi:Hypothetical predicted protein [Mytilus galloprovincialis]|uniref:ATPase AAA-type core domain-containing protein n=1 Tax=Mytilus galloprovincialis TaxID=29158 RepID=A0A8B6BG02_MYTGA|nr:Hypothetical predicted protein [Mytilus galloprovincialis]